MQLVFAGLGLGRYYFDLFWPEEIGEFAPGWVGAWVGWLNEIDPMRNGRFFIF